MALTDQEVTDIIARKDAGETLPEIFTDLGTAREDRQQVRQAVRDIRVADRMTSLSDAQLTRRLARASGNATLIQAEIDSRV